MRHKSVFALVATGIGAATVFVAAPAGAQEELSLEVDPMSGPAGTDITVSGAGCTSENPDDAPEVEFIFADEEFFFGEGEGLVGDDDLVQAGDDGTWSGQLTVPADTDPDLSWFVSALCFAGPDAEEPLAVYEIVEFDVTAPPTPEPPTNPPTPPTPPAAPPAVPVVEEPSFTG